MHFCKFIIVGNNKYPILVGYIQVKVCNMWILQDLE